MARAVAALALLSFVAGCKRPPTFAGDVAPILYARCAPCHHDGGAAPFSLTSYDDAARRATQIARVTARRYMPPWKATFGVAYANERRLGDDEIATLRRWAEARAPLGRRDAVPAPPAFTGGWALGKPDAVVTLPAYPLGAGGSDEYRNFVVRAPVSGTRWVKAWELQPHGRTIHHAIINIDRNGILRKREGSDGKPGFSGMEASDAQSPDGFYLVWTPGQPPTPPAVGQAWRLDADTDLVVQLHLRPSGKPETVQPQVALYFADGPPSVPRMTLRIGDLPIDLAPGARFTMRDAVTLPVDVDVLALFPHLHYLGRTVRVRARLPGDPAERALLDIDDWDPGWQDKYVLAAPLHLPAGSTLSMELGYDNSTDNPRNPHVPPERVHTGERTVDEMGNVTFELRLAGERDKVQLRELKYRREIDRGGGARAWYNLGNTLGERARFAEAIAAFRHAVELQPSLMPAHANLGQALLVSGDVDGAIGEFEAALKLEPDNARLRAMLAQARAKKSAR